MDVRKSFGDLGMVSTFLEIDVSRDFTHILDFLKVRLRKKERKKKVLLNSLSYGRLSSRYPSSF